MAADSERTGDFVEAGISINQTEIRDLAVSEIEGGFPGLTLRPGHLLWLLADATAEMRVDLALLLLDVARFRFRAFGRGIAGIIPTEETFATGSIEVTTLDPDPDALADRTITAGSQVSLGDALFRTSEDATFAPGDTATIAIVADQAGSAGSGITAIPTFQEPFGFVDTVTLTGVTTGGVDAEPDDVYEEALARRYRHMGRPILVADFSERAREIVGVDRALTLDGYDAVAHTTGNERTVTIAVADSAGQAASTGVKNAVQALIESEREVNWDVFVIDPTYTTVDISATVSVYEPYIASDIETRAEQAVADFLDPGTWGNPPFGPQPDWHDEPEVLLSEVYTVLNNVEGVRHVTALTMGWVRAATASASTNVVTSAGHGLTDTEEITFTGLAGGAPLVAGTTYFVRDSATDTFKVALTSGGAAIDITTDMTAGFVHHQEASTISLLTPAPLPRAGTIAVTAA